MTPEFLAWIVQNWVRCEEYIQRAVDRTNGAVSIDYVWNQVIGGGAQFWPGAHGAVVTKIEQHPSGMNVALGWLAGGDDMDELKDIEARISKWAKDMGCARFEIIGRRGWLRALKGYREGDTLLVKDL